MRLSAIFLPLLLSLSFCGCDLAYPQVVIVNQLHEQIMIKNPSFNGCVWNVVLAYQETTSPERCLPGADHVHWQKFDALDFAEKLNNANHLDAGMAPDGDAGLSSARQISSDASTVSNITPTWFPYRTISLKQVDYGDFAIFSLMPDDLEQDFSVPGPYGH